MKSFCCRDLGLDCDFVTKGETTQVVVAAAYLHSVKHHPEVCDYMFGDKAAALMTDMEAVIKDE